jgi:DNA polymerase-3 subunit beta
MEGESIGLSVNETLAGVYSENLELISRLLQGQYPEYEKVIPQDNDKKLIVDRQKLIQALRQIEVFAQRVSEMAQLMLLKDTTELILVSCGEGFKSEVKVGCEYNGEEIKIGFNAKYLLEILSAIRSDQIEWTLKDSVSPMLLTPVNKTDELYLLMPIRLE